MAGAKAHSTPRSPGCSAAGSTTTGRRLTGPAGLWFMPMTATASDDEAVTALALSAAKGNGRALEAFIKATQQDVWRFVAYLSDVGSADDLTQETFLRAIGAIPRFSARSSARTWLLAIARHVVADHIRHVRSRPRTTRGARPEHLIDGDRHARGFEDLVEVTTMIADLTTDQREALLLTQLLGLSYADAAAVCGCPVGTIRSRVARARRCAARRRRWWGCRSGCRYCPEFPVRTGRRRARCRRRCTTWSHRSAEPGRWWSDQGADQRVSVWFRTTNARSDRRRCYCCRRS